MLCFMLNCYVNNLERKGILLHIKASKLVHHSSIHTCRRQNLWVRDTGRYYSWYSKKRGLYIGFDPPGPSAIEMMHMAKRILCSQGAYVIAKEKVTPR